MVVPERGHVASEGKEIDVEILPVDPGQLVVLTEPVVVALLGAADLIPMGDHRHALGQQQRREEITLLARPQCAYLGIVGWSFVPAVPRPVVALAVPVVFAVGLVVLLVVGDKILQREAVMGGDEVYRCDRTPGRVLVQVG